MQPGGCDPQGAWFQRQTAWLAQDLNANHAKCTLAYWHQPLFSAADPGNPDLEGAVSRAWWDLLYQHGADVVLNGHEHLYARFAPMSPSGQPDTETGIRQFIVGTEGEGLDALAPAGSVPQLQAGQDQGYGVINLTLDKHSYSWNYSTTLGPAFSDTGRQACH